MCLWNSQDEGLKDGRVVAVLATVKTGDKMQLFVAPITHSAPGRAANAIAMPANVKRDLGLDRERSWIVTTEVNCFLWPGPDVRPLGGGDPFYGTIPDWLFVQVREAIGGRAERGVMTATPRTG